MLKYHRDSPLTGRIALAAMMALLAATLLLSCHNRNLSGQERHERFLQLDSMMRHMADVDSLRALVDQSHEQNDALAEMIALKYMGKALRHQSRFNEAVEAHSRCYELAVAAHDTVAIITSLDDIATCYRRVDDYSAANGYYYQALRLYDEFSDHKSPEVVKCHVVTLNGIGNIELEWRHYYNADSIFHQALQGEKSLGSNVGIAINCANLGTVKRALGQNDSAWVYFRESLRYNQLAGDAEGVALCHHSFGELYESERSYSRALIEYKMAYDTLRHDGESWHWLDPCLALGRLNLLLGEKAEARQYQAEAEAEAKRINSKEHLAQAYELHSHLALLDGDTKTALEYYVQSDQLLDSIYGLEMNEEMRRQRVSYQSTRKSSQFDMLNKDINRLKNMRNRMLLFTVLLSLMALAVIGALVYAMRVRSRTQRLMRQVEETRSLFFTNVVHQLRSPLSAIMGAIDGLTAEEGGAKPLPESQRMNAEVIERQGKNLLLLVDRILEVGSVRSAIKDLEWSTIDAVTFLHMIVESYRDSVVPRHIELSYVPRENSVDIDTVPSYLKTIVCSLLENAINYNRDYGKIVITSRVDGDMLTIRVADNGMGISKEDLQHVFEPFYRGSTAEHLVDGIGIGLTVVRDMAMAMGGTVAANSRKEHGSVFIVKLPCKRGGVVKKYVERLPKPARNWMQRAPRVDQDETSSPSDIIREDLPVVLVVEDHDDVARMVGLVLEKDYAVHHATDGERGLAKACELLPDLIITDVRMPLMDGIEMCRALRASRQLCHIPVIMLSARTSDKDRIRGIEAGADAYLLKPFVREELRTWAKHLVESRRTLRDVFTDPVKASPGPLLSPSNGSDDNDQNFLTEFARELDKQFIAGEKLDLDKVARAFKMGETQLRRKLQSLTGKNVSAYITQLRMEKAMRLLTDSPEMRIGDIAEVCGFQDVAYFSRVFRQHYGIPPSQARAQR